VAGVVVTAPALIPQYTLPATEVVAANVIEDVPAVAVTAPTHSIAASAMIPSAGTITEVTAPATSFAILSIPSLRLSAYVPKTELSTVSANGSG